MTIFNTLKSRAFKFCFFGTMAVTAFILGKQIVAQGYGEIMLGHDILIGVIALLFFTAIGELASSIGDFSAVGYVVVTFFAALTCYVLSPVWQALNICDLTDAYGFVDVINGGYAGFAAVYITAYILTLFLGFVIHKKDILAKEEA